MHAQDQREVRAQLHSNRSSDGCDANSWASTTAASRVEVVGGHQQLERRLGIDLKLGDLAGPRVIRVSQLVVKVAHRLLEDGARQFWELDLTMLRLGVGACAEDGWRLGESSWRRAARRVRVACVGVRSSPAPASMALMVPETSAAFLSSMISVPSPATILTGSMLCSECAVAVASVTASPSDAILARKARNV